MSVSVKYKGNEIAKLTATGTKTLNTEGKYCEGNIIVENTEASHQEVEQATPSLSLNAATGEVTAEATQAAGLVAAGTKKATMQLATQVAKTVTPSAAQQTAVASGKYTTGDVVVAAVPAEAKTVELSMPSGDQTVSPNGGKFLSAVTVKKPATMLPENIKKGVSIGGVVGTLESGGGGGGGAAVSPKDINFYDYDGTCVAAWSLAELAGKTSLPDYPAHEGLTCQGWNWTLADLKAENAKMNVGAMYITTDGKTRIYITLQEGRKSPMLGICPNGTVTVDWGDGTTPDTLTGTSLTTVKWTPRHSYAAPGDYVITLTVDGLFGISGSLLRYSSGSDNRNYAYQNAIQRVFLGNGATSINQNAFQGCYSLAQITIPSGVTSINQNAFQNCYSLAQITLPSGVTNIGERAFQNCYSLAQITLPSGIIRIDNFVFSNCYSLASITLLSGITSIGNYAFQNCYSMAFYDFTACTAVPTLSNSNAFINIPADCEIRVPAALLDEWKAATNWATYASHIVGV